MFKYPETGNSTSVHPTHRIRGQYLARARLSRKQRAQIAADLVDGTAVISPFTAKQAATLANVPPVEVTKVRRANGNGKRSSPKSTESLAEHIRRSSLAERIEAARAVGVDAIWDSMISPVITAEQASAAE